MSKNNTKYILVPAKFLHNLACGILALDPFEERDEILDQGIKWGLIDWKCATPKDIEKWRNQRSEIEEWDYDDDNNLSCLDAGDEYYDIGTLDEMIERIILKDVQKSAEQAAEEKHKKVKIMTHKQKHYKECVANDDLKEAGLSPRSANVLRAHGIFTVEALMKSPKDYQSFDDYFLKFPGMGDKGIDELRAIPEVVQWFDLEFIKVALPLIVPDEEQEDL